MENKAYFESSNGNYEIVCLCKRDNIDLANITEDEFVELMKEDLANAFINYKDLLKEPVEKAKASSIEYAGQKAREYAQTRWKTERKIQQYVDSEMDKASKNPYYDDTVYNISFTIKPDKWRNETPGVCVLHKKTDENQLRDCFNEIKNSKYFKNGKGWVFRYETNSKKFPTYSFVPYIDIILDETMSNLQKQDENNLNQAINDFYKNSKYIGD